MICLEEVNKICGGVPKQVNALKNINLRINEGEFIVIRGPGGSGKTTLLLSIGGRLQPSSGMIKIENENLYSMSERGRNKFRTLILGFVFQMFYLIPYLNVIENIMLSPGIEKDKNIQDKAIKLAEQLGLGKGFTVIFVTHGKDINQYADRIFYLNKGAIT